MASVDAANPPAPPAPPSSSHRRRGITVDDLKHIDIRELSQSELQSLSLSSDSAYDVQQTDDVLTPDVDRSVFNESAGSRRQTYSRLHHRSLSRLPALHPSLKPHRHAHSSPDPVSHSIVHFLKHFLNGNHNPPPPPPPPQLQEPPKAVAEQLVGLGFLGLQEDLKIKCKRVRSKNSDKSRVLENGVGIEMQQVNGKGEVVDFAELERKGDELYSEELKRRTVGLETEEGVLGFLWDLEGQWCSRRKRRKYVDAGLFGDALPIGWKLLLGLRRCDYRVSVYCRRYISPGGQQFMSCREAASFLKSYFEGNATDYTLSSEKNANSTDKKTDIVHGTSAQSTLARNSSNSHENDDSLMGIENLPEVQVRDIFECFRCNLTFDEKNPYLQHLFSVHQKTTKRYKVGTPVGEGVIIKDGKYECQFCHKVFDERRSYNGHVGVHVRNSGKNTDELAITIDVQKDPESPLQEAVSSRSSKMDALIEIAQNSISETPTIGTGDQAITDQSDTVLRLEEAQAASTYHEANLSSHPVEIHVQDFCADRAPDEDLNHSSQVVKPDNDMVMNDYALNMNIKTDVSCINVSEPLGSNVKVKYEESVLDMGYGNGCLKPSDDHLEDTTVINVGEVFQDGVTSVPPMVQSFQFFPPFDSVSDKGEHEFSMVDQKLENVTGFEELTFDDIEPYKYGFVNEHELPSLPGSSMNLGINNGMEEDGFNCSVRFGSEGVMLNTLETNHLTVCVWCRTEFKLEGIELEAPSDSIGYMCPTCKARISGHFSGGLSMDPHDF